MASLLSGLGIDHHGIADRQFLLVQLAADPDQTWRLFIWNDYFLLMFQKNDATDGITPLMLSR